MNRPTPSLRTLALVLLLPLAATACATAGAGAGDEDATTVVVENNLTPPSAISVHALPEFGGRRFVGHVSAGATERLTFRANSGFRDYRFVAETTAGREIASNTIAFSPGATVRWTLSANIATVEEEGGG